METKTLLTVLQLSDSAFPTGGFSHSLGLESASQYGLIFSKGDFNNVIVSSLENAGSFSLPFVCQGHKDCEDLSKIKELDILCQACTSNHVVNRASRRQGKAFLETTRQVYCYDGLASLGPALCHCHYAVVFGAVCGMIGLDLQMTLTSFMFGTLRTLTASAVRLDIIGPVKAQGIQASFQNIIPDIISRNKDRNTAGACLTFPVIDILQNAHDTLFCKLFYS